VRVEAAASEIFQMRKLLWDELKLNVRASEEEELRSAVGSQLIQGNEVRRCAASPVTIEGTHSLDPLRLALQELRQELAALAEILTEFQQQNDDIRVSLKPRTSRLLPKLTTCAYCRMRWRSGRTSPSLQVGLC
jgi:hypothetical protein